MFGEYAYRPRRTRQSIILRMAGELVNADPSVKKLILNHLNKPIKTFKPTIKP